jgi:hypothetical protein
MARRFDVRELVGVDAAERMLDGGRSAGRRSGRRPDLLVGQVAARIRSLQAGARGQRPGCQAAAAESQEAA